MEEGHPPKDALKSFDVECDEVSLRKPCKRKKSGSSCEVEDSEGNALPTSCSDESHTHWTSVPQLYLPTFMTRTHHVFHCKLLKLFNTRKLSN